MKPKEVKPKRSLFIRFETQEDVDTFSKLVCQDVLFQTKEIWFPKMTVERYNELRYTK